MLDYIMGIVWWMIVVVPCLAGYKYFTKQSLELPTKYIAEKIIYTNNIMAEKVVEKDNDLLMRAKSALYDYHYNPKFGKSFLIKCREKLVNRYQKYKYMKKDNEAKIPRRYMELRMNEFFDFLQTMPPF